METSRLILPSPIGSGSFTQDCALQILPSPPQEVLSDLHRHFCFWSLDFSWTAAASPSFPEISKCGKRLFSSGATPSSCASGEGRTAKVNGPDELVQTMFALSRSSTESGPLQIYMAISELDSRRSPGHRLAPETVRLLARKFEGFSDQYRMFSEFPELSDESIALFLDVAQGLNNGPSAVRGNALGMFQANVGIWQILARQGQISSSHLNDSWQQVIKPFATIRSGTQLYDAGRTSLEGCSGFRPARLEGRRTKSSSCWRDLGRLRRREGRYTAKSPISIRLCVGRPATGLAGHTAHAGGCAWRKSAEGNSRQST